MRGGRACGAGRDAEIDLADRGVERTVDVDGPGDRILSAGPGDLLAGARERMPDGMYRRSGLDTGSRQFGSGGSVSHPF